MNDWAGYSTPGYARPRRGRFWVPLIALFSGMRMNEICQLHVADIHRLDGVDCFFVTEGPSDADNGKRLKTAASERFIPVHPTLIEIGFMTFVEQRRAAGAVRLFSELQKSSTGYYSDPFSKWFRRFLERAGATREKTCFHSFRHCYRDALRESRIEHELALALGGWSSGTGSEGVKPQPPTGAAIVPKHCMPRLEGLIIPNWICRTLFRLMNVIQRPVILLLADSTVTS